MDELPRDARTLVIPVWCRAQCRVLYPQLGIGEFDSQIIARLRGDYSLARRSEPLLYALRQALTVSGMREYLRSHPRAAIIDLGCGLDNVLRLVPGGGERIYADLPEVLRLRERLMPPCEGERYIACDARDISPLSGVDASNGVCIVMSGLLYNLKPDEVRTLFASLSRLFPGAQCIFDGNGKIAARRVGDGVLRSTLPGARKLRRWEGVASARPIKALPEGFRRLTLLKRLRLRLMLSFGVSRFFECTLE